MRTAIRRYVRKQQYQPGWPGVLLNPFFLARRSLWRAMQQASPSISGPLLDVGCGTKPYETLFPVDRYVGMDIDNPSTRLDAAADVYYDGGRFPFDDGQFRGVLCNQVLEHVFTPDAFLAEIHRVLEPGGRLLLTVPFVWDEHMQPFDYARYSSFGLASLLERAGFRIVEHRKLMADVSVIFQLGNAYLFKVTHTKSFAANVLLTACLMAPLSLLGALLGSLLPRNDDLFLDQLVIAEKL